MENFFTYDNNDVCLVIYPYDNYKIISIYKKDSEDVDVEYSIDRRDIYKYYLDFGGGTSTKNRVTIPECKDYYTSDNNYITLADNELLFKISKSDAINILSLSSNVFNVVRELNISDDEYFDGVYETQTIFTGRWASSEEKGQTDYAKLIQELQDKLSQLLEENNRLTIENISLSEENANLISKNEGLMDYEKYKDMYEELVNKNELGNEYTAETIANDATIINVKVDDSKLSSEINSYLETLQDTTQI